MVGQRDGVAQWTAVTAVIAWVLANGLDVLSVLLALLQGGGLLGYHHPAEQFIIYVGVRLLMTLGVSLLAALASKHWTPASRAAWWGLTAGAALTSITAWWRIVR